MDIFNMPSRLVIYICTERNEDIIRLNDIKNAIRNVPVKGESGAVISEVDKGDKFKKVTIEAKEEYLYRFLFYLTTNMEYDITLM